MNRDCTRFAALLSASWDAPLAVGEQKRFDAHLAECPACVGRMKGQVVLRTVLQGLSAAEEGAAAPLAEPLVARLAAAMRSAAAERGTRAKSRGA